MGRPILVTGSHRSGSTWVGNIISSNKKVFYIQEPFNLSIPRENSPCDYWFEYVDCKSKKRKDEFKEYLRSFYSPYNLYFLKDFFKIRTSKNFIQFLKEYKRRSVNRALIKDPLALMSAEWMHENLECDVVVVIRHPAAFVASLKIKDWQFDFKNFSNQQALVETYLHDWKREIKDFSQNNRNIIEQGILLWNCIYSVVSFYHKKYQNRWYFVKHEDLSKNPIFEFEKIFDFLELRMDEPIKNWINETSNSDSDSGFKRNSRENIGTWKQRLTVDEVKLIKDRTKPVWTNFYKEDDWN